MSHAERAEVLSINNNNNFPSFCLLKTGVLCNWTSGVIWWRTLHSLFFKFDKVVVIFKNEQFAAGNCFT